eukprot:comp20522_c0_seq1/m.26286 comp20522_c0_seq1/g.26286  ORF comp20522_c0_seq1/g.26286 comp20522_c0_seq1/m.26286 type:complete len:312 (-) comp20522_c0_seq1:503-1438(-)
MYADAVIPMKGNARASLTDRFSEIQRQREHVIEPQQTQAQRTYVNNNNNQPKQVPSAVNAQARALLQAARQAARNTQVAARRNINVPKTANAQVGGAKRNMPPGQRQANGNGKQGTGAVPVVGKSQKRQQIGGKLAKRPGAATKKAQPERRPLVERLGPKKGEKQLPPSVKNMKTPLSQNLLKRIRLAQLSTQLGGKKVVQTAAPATGNKQLVRKANPLKKKGDVKTKTKGVKDNKAAAPKQGSPTAQTGQQKGKKRRNKIRTAGAQAGTQKPAAPKQTKPKTPKKETDPEKMKAQLDMDMDTYMAPVGGA